MSSTDNRAERFEAFFDKLSAVARKDGGYFPRELGAGSYYVTREADPAQYVQDLDMSDLAELLRKRWTERPEFAALIPELVRLYEENPPREDDERGDVSPFIYEMF